MSETIEVTRVIPAKPERIFNAWLSADEHGLMTSSSATYNDATGEFTAWDGYITGRTLEKQAAARFVQAWRTTEFPDGVPDSMLEVRFDAVEDGTKVTLVQTEIPDGQGESYEVGWSDHYFDPMTDYFQSARSRIKDAGEALTEAAEQVGETIEAAGKEVKRAAKKVQKSAKQAGKKVQKLVATAKKKIQAASRKATQKKPAKKAKARKAAPKRKVAKKKAGKKRR